LIETGGSMRRLTSTAALIALLGCGGGTTPPQNVTPSTTESPRPQGPDVDQIIARANAEAVAELDKQQKALRDNSIHVTATTDALATARDDAHRTELKLKLEGLKKQELDIEQKISEAQNAVARVKKMEAAKPCVDHLDTLAIAKPDDDKPGVLGLFENAKDRDAQKTQECCVEEMTAFGAIAKHRRACCDVLGGPPKGADQTACTP
jgi:hypothetical protein